MSEKLKLFKPIYPARDLGYSPTYKNNYSGEGMSVVGQHFGDDKVCETVTEPFERVPKYGATCPPGYTSLYKKLGLNGHNGIDIPCVSGTPVFSAHSGTVTKLSTKPTYGLGVTIQSEDGSFVTLYWHLKEILVSVGQKVRELDLIGLANSTGYSTGNHLHFGYYPSSEPKTNGYDGAIDPTPFIIEKPQFTFNSNLWLGKSGEDVRNLQIALAHEGFLGQVGFYGFTGYFGLQTLEAVRMFQRKYGIMTTGFVGKLTRAKLNEIYGK